MAKKKKPAAASVPVAAHKHVADRRPNIPTRETAAFAADDTDDIACWFLDTDLGQLHAEWVALGREAQEQDEL